MRDIKNELQEVFREVFDDDALSITNEMTAKDYEGWDSLAHINLLVAAEKRFGVRFATGEISNLKNVGDFIRLIQNKLGG